MSSASRFATSAAAFASTIALVLGASPAAEADTGSVEATSMLPTGSVFGESFAGSLDGSVAAPLPAGSVVAREPASDTARLPSAVRSERITYVSTGASGAPVLVTGLVDFPAGDPPTGGWPVMSWAHGTTGVADPCAPSLDSPGGSAHDYLAAMQPDLNAWLDRGYVVVRTDYEGLGTPGVHPYLNAASETHSVTDIVRAARRLDARVSPRWVVTGHSQGGQAALFTAQWAKDFAPDLQLLAAVAIAPGSGFGATVDYVRAGMPGSAAAARFLPVIVLGAGAVSPAVQPDKIFSDTAAPLLAAGRSGCLADIAKVPPVPAEQVFRPGVDLTPLTTYLNAQEPALARPRVPVLLAQGTADVLVDPRGTARVAETLCAAGTELDYRTYAGADHRDAVRDSLQDAIGFADSAFAGRPAPRACS